MRRPAALAFAATAAVLLSVLLTLPPTGFFSADSGPKYWQCLAFAEGSGLPRGFDYPAAGLDPGRRHIPPFTAPVGDQLASIYPVLFPLTAAGLHAIGGDRAMRLLPWLAALAAAWLTGRLAGVLRNGRTSWTTAALALAATPLAFYALAFWEHSMATAMVLGGLVLAAQGARTVPGAAWPWAGLGLLIGLGAWVRTEVVFLAPALALVALRRDWRVGWRGEAGFLAGCSAGLGAGAAVQRVAVGSWLPLHVTYHADSSFALRRFVASRLESLLDFVAPDVWCGLAAVSWIIAMAAVLSRAGARSRSGLLAAFAAVAASAAAAGPAPAIRWLGGVRPTEAFPVSAPAATWILLSALPLLLWGQPRAIRLDRGRLLLGLLAGWSIAAVLLARPIRSFEWGSRLFLTAVLLLLAVLGSLELADGPLRRLRRATLAGCIAAAVVVQGLGLVLLCHSTATHQSLARAVAAHTTEGEPVLTDSYMIPLLAGRGWETRRYLYVTGEAGVARLAAACARQGIGRWTYATLAGRGDRARPQPRDVTGSDGSRWTVRRRLELAAGSERLEIIHYRREPLLAASR